MLGEAERLKEEWSKEKAGIVRERMQAVKLGLEGELGLSAIAQRLGRSRHLGGQSTNDDSFKRAD